MTQPGLFDRLTMACINRDAAKQALQDAMRRCDTRAYSQATRDLRDATTAQLRAENDV